MSTLFVVTLVVFIAVSLFLMLLVLIQRSRGGGLAGAFDGGEQSAFGPKTGDVLTWTTSFIVGIFILLAIVLNLMVNARIRAGMEKVTTLESMVVPTDGASSDVA